MKKHLIVTTSHGKQIDWEAAFNLMDEDLCNAIASAMAPCTEQEYYDEYCKRHLVKFGVQFAPDDEGGQW